VSNVGKSAKMSANRAKPTHNPAKAST